MPWILGLGFGGTVAFGPLVVADNFNHRIRLIDVGGAVTTLAGSVQGFLDGTGNTARFKLPRGVHIDASGHVWVADTQNFAIRHISPTGVVTTVAGNGVSGHVDAAIGTNARFTSPRAISGPRDGSGTLYISDGNTIRQMHGFSPYPVETRAGNPTAGYVDTGLGGSDIARFNDPWGLDVDNNGVIYVCDLGNQVIRRIDIFGSVSTFAGGFEPGGSQHVDGANLTAARFGAPFSLVIDDTGRIFVGDGESFTSGGDASVRVIDAGFVSTLPTIGTMPVLPMGIARSSDGTIYVSDPLDNRIRVINLANVVSIYAGDGTAGSIDGTGTGARLNNPEGIDMDHIRGIPLPPSVVIPETIPFNIADAGMLFDGDSVWISGFGGSFGGRMARFDVATHVIEDYTYTAPTVNAFNYGLVFDGDKLWTAGQETSWVAVFDRNSHTAVTYNSFGAPFIPGIAFDGDNVYTNGRAVIPGDSLVRWNSNGTNTHFDAPSVAPDGHGVGTQLNMMGGNDVWMVHGAAGGPLPFGGHLSLSRVIDNTGAREYVVIPKVGGFNGDFRNSGWDGRFNWLAGFRNGGMALLRFDPLSRNVIDVPIVGGSLHQPHYLDFDGTNVWISTNLTTFAVTKINRFTLAKTVISDASKPSAILAAFDGTHMWVLDATRHITGYPV